MRRARRAVHRLRGVAQRDRRALGRRRRSGSPVVPEAPDPVFAPRAPGRRSTPGLRALGLDAGESLLPLRRRDQPAQGRRDADRRVRDAASTRASRHRGSCSSGELDDEAYLSAAESVRREIDALGLGDARRAARASSPTRRSPASTRAPLRSSRRRSPRASGFPPSRRRRAAPRSCSATSPRTARRSATRRSSSPPRDADGLAERCCESSATRAAAPLAAPSAAAALSRVLSWDAARPAGARATLVHEVGAMAEPLSFCMVTTFYPPYHFGGDAMYLYRLTNALARARPRVTVVHCDGRVPRARRHGAARRLPARARRDGPAARGQPARSRLSPA